MQFMRIRNLFILIVCLALLVVSHWFAYYRGKKHGEEAFRSFGHELVVEGQYRQLRSHVAILRVMVKNPDRFSEGEIRAERVKGEQALIGGERLVLPRFQETGNEARAREAQSLLNEGRELFAKLPK